jgi:hypothetical protein
MNLQITDFWYVSPYKECSEMICNFHIQGIHWRQHYHIYGQDTLPITGLLQLTHGRVGNQYLHDLNP